MTELHYRTVPANAGDFGLTFEQWGSVPGANPPVGSGPGIILSRRARSVLIECGVRVGGAPVVIGGTL